MGNVGAIARTMVGLGIANLALIKPAIDIFDPKTVRASMGAVFRLSFEYFDSFGDYRDNFGHNLYPLMTNGRESIDRVRFKPPFALIFGSESHGLSDEYLDAGTSVAIPHSSRIDSFNLSIAAAIAIYESTKPYGSTQ
jgi:TrmH family RNA methyltransferase